jgi:hypothetical protein
MSPNKRSILPIISFVLLLFLFVSTFSSSVFAVTNPCDPAFTSIDEKGHFLVSPSMDSTGVTDTTNLQCVHNAIENQSFHAVKLSNGNFYVKEIKLNCPSYKECTFAGTTRAGTILDVVDNSIDCQGRWDSNVVPGGLHFRGKILVQYFTIRGNSPCMNDDFLPGLIIFTGAPAVVGDKCKNSVLFGDLNRVDVIALSWNVDHGVLVTPQGRWIWNGVCHDTLSGSFTSTRTNIDGPWHGLLVSMHASARIGIDFLVSTNSAGGVEIWDSNAIAAVNFCTINGTAPADSSYFGVGVFRLEGGPNTTTTSINKCTFNLANEPGAWGAWGVVVQDFDAPSSMPTVVSASIFNHAGSDTFGIEFGDVSNCTITGNRFNGDAGTPINLFSYDAPLSGCTVTANTSLPALNVFYEHIYAAPGSFDNVLGYYPGASVIDLGCNFDLNAPDGGCALGGGDSFKNSVSTDSPGSTASRKLGPRYFRTTDHGKRQIRSVLHRHISE